MIAENLINIHNKRTSTGEIIVTLFEFCDLSCLFCNQDHNSVLGIDTVVDKFEEIKLCIETLQKKGKKDFAIHIMGGEVFSDKLKDSIYNDYKILVDKINRYGIENEIPIVVSFVTNFVWKKTDRVKKFLDESKVEVLTSYDPAGRFNVENFEIYKQNIQEFKNYVTSVNVIITKPNIDKFMKNQIPFFDYLYENFSIYFDYYGPENNKDLLMPKDVEVREFMKYMIDHWPNVAPMKNFHKKESMPMTCMDTYTVLPTGKWGGCGQFEKIDHIIPIKKVTEQQWFDSYNCIECEHFQRCSLGCFMSNHVRDMRTQEVCWLKEVYDYVDSKH